ncbi:hypothetical protein [Saccharibacillus alkalitolerans]|uniref:Uncharacterized protein n=1 Tax=Saccharibacillus alkalitolerans TaxID=2705290 RepID=A0ABX0F5T1_9BACL|nr:hypothetical protein [Saccharibacillus alkalitolerans]NGZ74973.1 hypothetical protein [Saccharibacillus alkalitolerans]
MTCTQPTKSVTSFPVVPAGSVPVHLTGTQANTATRFVCSDNPETISGSVPFPNGFVTLWHDTTTGRSSIRYRVFLWHLNGRSTPIKLGITIGNAGSTSYSVHNLSNSVAIAANYVEHGKCMAAALLGGTMDNIAPTDSSIAAGNVGVVKEWVVPAGSLVGGVLEFTLSNTAASVGLNYRLRTVAASNSSANLRLNQNPVTDYVTGGNGELHPRGSWNFADIDSSVSYAAGDGWKYYNMSNGVKDNLMTSENSYDPSPGSTKAVASNKGHYGVKYSLTVNLSNPTSVQKTVKIYVGARVKPYGGALQWSGDGVTYKVPTLAGPQEGATTQAGVEVATVTLAPNQSLTRILSASTAGSLSTPALLAFQTV